MLILFAEFKLKTPAMIVLSLLLRKSTLIVVADENVNVMGSIELIWLLLIEMLMDLAVGQLKTPAFTLVGELRKLLLKSIALTYCTEGRLKALPST